MNGLSFKELCCLFCCPPCPGRIAAKLAFLPPEPTYSFGGPKLSADGDSTTQSPQLLTFRLTERSEWQYSQTELDMIDVFMTRSARGNRVACTYVHASPNAKFTLLFSHGNAVDLGQMSSFYVGLATRINCNIFRYLPVHYGFPVTDCDMYYMQFFRHTSKCGSACIPVKVKACPILVG